MTRAPQPGGACVYREREQTCTRPVAWVVKFDGAEHPMCERHVRPEFYPRDLRKTLPGRIRKLARAVAQPRSYGGRP